MKLTFENLGTNTYLVYEIHETDELDSMSLGMLTNNSIPGFAPASFTQMDATKYIKYNVSAKVSVKQLFSGPVNKKRLIGVFSGVANAMLAAEDYMLDSSTILLDMDYIFADVTTCETELVCLPIMNLQCQNQDLSTFFKNILFTTQFDQTENCDHVAQLINYLNTNPVLMLEDFKALLDKLSNGPASQPKVEIKSAPQPEVKPQPVVQPVVTPAPSPAPAPAPAPAFAPIPTPVRKEAPAAKTPPVIPGVPSVASAQPKVAASNDEKPMSWFYLMQHYNKENAAIYKAQQDAKKAKGAVPTAPQQAKPVPQKPTPMANSSFVVPGKQPGFAIPGQPAPTPAAPKPVAAPQPEAAATCPKCGQPIQADQAFCTSCGMRCGSNLSPAPAPAPVAAPQPVYQPAPQVQSAPLNFGETTVLSAAVGETTVLSAAMEMKKNDPHLIRSKNNEKIPLNKPVFRIGKERSYVDYFIGDNTAISRGHANIVDHNGEYFVVDTNSTNHTYLNGAIIQPGVEMKLAHGDKVRLANEDFEFKLY